MIRSPYPLNDAALASARSDKADLPGSLARWVGAALLPLGLLAGVPGQAQTLAAAAGAALPAPDMVVGQVSLLIGEAKVFKRDGASHLLKQGGAIAVGDRIETAANGHVHVRFVDNAVVSVRPDSVLEVQSYRYDATNPQLNEVRLKVAQGVTRSISGAATETDKGRFRLNTPIAAIGVRGTDFIVQASQDDARATVANGTIVMSPLGNGCSAEALGPCAGRSAQVLSADMGRLMVELRHGERVPRVVPAADQLLASGTPSAESRASIRAMAMAATQQLLAEARLVNNDRDAAQLLQIAPLGPFDARELNSPPDRSAKLAWGRYFDGAAQGYQNIVMSLKDAASGRTVTIGDGSVGLFRAGSPADAEAALNSLTGTRVDFRLSRAQASFETNSGRSEAASVDGGTLAVDFLNRRFATALALSSDSGGKAELRAAGDITRSGNLAGTFSAVDAEQSVVGALSLDGKEAGYAFSRLVGSGVFKGRTLWGR